MNSNLKATLKKATKEMYLSLTMMDAALLVNSDQKFHEELKRLKETIIQCEQAMQAEETKSVKTSCGEKLIQ